MFKWVEESVSGYDVPCLCLTIHSYFLLLLQIMFNLSANYLTEANILKWGLPGTMPDTERSFTGQRLSSLSVNGGRMEGT